MTQIGLRLLRSQQEFANRTSNTGVSDEFAQPGWAPRSEEQIAADYEAALRELLASP